MRIHFLNLISVYKTNLPVVLKSGMFHKWTRCITTTTVVLHLLLWRVSFILIKRMDSNTRCPTFKTSLTSFAFSSSHKTFKVLRLKVSALALKKTEVFCPNTSTLLISRTNCVIFLQICISKSARKLPTLHSSKLSILVTALRCYCMVGTTVNYILKANPLCFCNRKVSVCLRNLRQP